MCCSDRTCFSDYLLQTIYQIIISCLDYLLMKLSTMEDCLSLRGVFIQSKSNVTIIVHVRSQCEIISLSFYHIKNPVFFSTSSWEYVPKPYRKRLGPWVKLPHNLSPNEHIQEICLRAYRSYCFIYRFWLELTIFLPFGFFIVHLYNPFWSTVLLYGYIPTYTSEWSRIHLCEWWEYRWGLPTERFPHHNWLLS